MAVQATDQKDDAGFNGTRFLLDASGSRQYAVNYVDGNVKPPLQVFDAGAGDKGSFKPNETIFAFDDELQNKTASGGQMIVSTVAYQINTNADGRPVHLKQVGVEYEMTFSVVDNAPQAVYKLTPESLQRVKDTGFSANFPVSISTSLEPGGFAPRATGSGLVIPDSKIASAPFLVSHPDNAALVARSLWVRPEPPKPVVVPAPAPKKTAPSPSRYTMADEQTLVEKKNLGDGDTLKIVFNFESRRVTEAVMGAGIKGYSFDKYDQTALESAFRQLQSMGGTPRPLEGKRPSLPKAGVG